MWRTGDRLFPCRDELIKVLELEPNVLANPGAADTPLPDGLSDPARRHMEILGRLVDVQETTARCLTQPAVLHALPLRLRAFVPPQVAGRAEHGQFDQVTSASSDAI
jgi:hypothetical protein